MKITTHHPGSKNLRPIKPGEKRALKDEKDRKTERIPIMVTRLRKEQLAKSAEDAGKTLSAYLLDGK